MACSVCAFHQVLNILTYHCRSKYCCKGKTLLKCMICSPDIFLVLHHEHQIVSQWSFWRKGDERVQVYTTTLVSIFHVIDARQMVSCTRSLMSPCIRAEDLDVDSAEDYKYNISAIPGLNSANARVNKIETLFYADNGRTEGYILYLVQALHRLARYEWEGERERDRVKRLG